MISVAGMPGEEGLAIACREGKLFRNDPKLEDLYKDGFRIYNYAVVEKPDEDQQHETTVKVFLEK